MCHIRNAAVVGLACLLAGPQAVAAQSPVRDALAVPERPVLAPTVLMCRRVAPMSTDTTAVAFRFIDGDSVSVRTTVVTFDSSGEARSMIVYVEPKDDHAETSSEMVGVDFYGSGDGVRFVSRGDAIDSMLPPQRGRDGKLLPRGATPVSTEDIGRARELTRWLWERRCATAKMSHPADRDPSAPGRSPPPQALSAPSDPSPAPPPAR